MDKVLHAPMPFTASGQTINDRLTAAYHSLAGSQLGKTVCKATTEEIMGPKKKHLDYLLHCSHEPNVSIPQMANLLIERTQNTNWCVVFKSLITIHNLMCYGNERFLQYLASSSTNLNLNNFLDKTTLHGYDMSTHIRRYAKYISKKIYTYRTMAFDFCKVKRGREDGLLRTMPIDKLMRTLPILQEQIDCLLEFQVSPSELNNGVINSCFILLFRDLIRLFACYNDGIINLLEKFFDLNKKNCKEALDLYKKFLTRMDKVSEFLKVAESVGIDKSEIPDLAKAPNSLLEALEQHLNSLEGQKGSCSRITSPTTNLTAHATQRSAELQEAQAAADAQQAFSDSMQQKYLEEEQKRMKFLKEQRLKELEFSQMKAMQSQNPFVDASGASETNMYPPLKQYQEQQNVSDLLTLSTNPFASEMSSEPYAVAGTGAGGWQPPTAAADSSSLTSSLFTGNGHVRGATPTEFVSDDSFAKAFGGGCGGSTGQVPREQRSGTEGFEEDDQTALARPFHPEETADQPFQEDAHATNPFLASTPPSTESELGGSEELFESKTTDSVQPELPRKPSDTFKPEAGSCPFDFFKQNAEALKSATSVKPAATTDLEAKSPPPHPKLPFDIAGGDRAHGLAVDDQPPHPEQTWSASSKQSQMSPADVHPTSSPFNISKSRVYLDTPFSNLDASYTSSPRLPQRVLQSQEENMPATEEGAVRRTAPLDSSGADQQKLGAADLKWLDPVLGDPLAPTLASTSYMPTGTKSIDAQRQARPEERGTKLVKGDLDSTIANLAQNLSIGRGSNVYNKPVQWNVPKQSNVESSTSGSFTVSPQGVRKPLGPQQQIPYIGNYNVAKPAWENVPQHPGPNMQSMPMAGMPMHPMAGQMPPYSYNQVYPANPMYNPNQPMPAAPQQQAAGFWQVPTAQDPFGAL